MATDSSALLQALIAGSPTSAADAKRLIEYYPYFAVPAAKAVSEGVGDSGQNAKFRAIAACNVGSRQALRKALGSDDEPFYPDERPKTLSTSATIDAFMAAFGAKTATEQAAEAPAADFSQLIASRRYEEALYLLEHRDLTNPEKSIYFADQIRYLRKLIINRKHLGK